MAIVRKDVLMVARNRGVRTPLLMAPVVILVVLPVILVTGGNLIAAGSPVPDVALAPSSLQEVTSPEFQARSTGLEGPGAWAVFVLEYFLAPLYLLVPLIVATVIAADSFAGERERGTLEALLHTPTTDTELWVAKVLAAWMPAVAVGLAGFVIYGVVANLVAWPHVGQVFFPTAAWLVLALWVTPAVAGIGLGTIVLVSSRVQSLQAAHQIGSLVVLPVILLVIAQVSGALLFDTGLVVGLGGILWIATIGLLAAGARVFHRDRLAARL